MRRILKVALACVVGLVLAVGVLLAKERWMGTPPPDPSGPIEVAPVRVPVEAPYVGPEGRDEHGYPTRVPDRAALRQAALARKFASLTTWIEQWQDAFEADWRHEFWPIDALDAFATPDPRLAPVIDEWVAAFPQSFVPYAAKGAYLNAVGFERRGKAWARDTSKKQFEDMATLHEHAVRQLEKALAMKPRLVAARRDLINIAMANGDDRGARAALDAALGACPDCFRVRVTYLHALRPKWGGSRAELAAFAETAASRADRNPRLAALRGFPDVDRCETFLTQSRFKDAARACDRALEFGPLYETYALRGTIARREERFAQAVDNYSRALALRPGDPAALADRARALYEDGRFDDAAQDALAALQIDPFAVSHWLHWSITDALVDAGIAHRTAGRADEALQSFDLALALDPHERRARKFRMEDAPEADEALLATLAARVEQEPWNFGACRDYDDALFPLQEYERIATAWTRYIAERPDDPYGYLERAGTHHHWGRRDEAKQDATKACALGLAFACGGPR